MNRRQTSSLAAVTLLVLATALAPAPAAAQEEPEMSPEAIEAMNAWMALAQPGDHHAHLARYAGRWESEIKMWMEPGGEPMVNPAMTDAQMILGGRYLESKHSGVFGGMPFEGLQLDAYNNGEQRYESTWADNFGTLIITYTGSCEDDGKVRTMSGEFFDPMNGGKIAQRAVYTWVDDDTWTYESWMSQGGEEFKNMEITYKRVE